MEISQKGVNLIKEFEGCKLNAYKDIAGVWTIGYGHTEGLEDGKARGIKATNKITQKQADDLLLEDISVFEKHVNQFVKVDLEQDMFDALVSFTFNVGAGNLRSSTLLKLLNQGKYLEASEQFPRWKYAGGVVSNGLVRRRKEEQRLFRSGFEF